MANKDKLVSIRFEDHELRMIEKAMRLSGREIRSRYIREAVMETIVAELSASLTDDEIDALMNDESASERA